MQVSTFNVDQPRPIDLVVASIRQIGECSLINEFTNQQAEKDLLAAAVLLVPLFEALHSFGFLVTALPRDNLAKFAKPIFFSGHLSSKCRKRPSSVRFSAHSFTNLKVLKTFLVVPSRGGSACSRSTSCTTVCSTPFVRCLADRLFQGGNSKNGKIAFFSDFLSAKMSKWPSSVHFSAFQFQRGGQFSI